MARPPYNGVIAAKLERMQESLQELRNWDCGSLEEFRTKRMLRSAVERELQVLVEIMIDICERILALDHVVPAQTAFENMHKAETSGVLADAETYRDMIRFRNFIVHRYEHVDPEIVYAIVTSKLGLFDRFIDEITRFIEAQDGC